MCVSASGPDKTGWVALVARAVADEGGNVTHSRMVRLGHEFIILMHVSVEPEKLKTLVKALNTDKRLLPLNIRASSLTRRQTGTYDKPLVGFSMKCVGEDRPGMLATISERVANLGLSVDNITTELRMDKRHSRREFVVSCDATTAWSDEESIDNAIQDISELKVDLGLDMLDIRVLHQNSAFMKRRETRARQGR